MLRRAGRGRSRPGRRPPGRAGALLRGVPGAPRLRPSRPRSDPAPGHAGLPQASTARRRKDRARALRASPICARATTSSTMPTGVSESCSASRRRPSAALPATTSSSRFAATTASTSPTSRSPRSRATSAPTGHTPALSKLGRQGLADDQEPGPRGRARAGGRAARALRPAAAGRGRRLRGRVRARRATRDDVSKTNGRGQQGHRPDGEEIETTRASTRTDRRRQGIVYQSFNLFRHMHGPAQHHLAPREVLGTDRAAARRMPARSGTFPAPAISKTRTPTGPRAASSSGTP